MRERRYSVDREGRAFHDEAEERHLCCRVRRGALRACLGRIAGRRPAPVLVEDAVGPAQVLGEAHHPICEPTPATS